MVARSPSSPSIPKENRVLARLLEETGDILSLQGANPFRVKAYHEAAAVLRQLDRGVREIWEAKGRDGLRRLPHIGESLSKAMETWLLTGTLGMLRRLRGEEAAERVLMSIAGLGGKLAHRIHHDLHINTLEDLEIAAHDGRLAQLEGIGERRIQAIRDQLATRLRFARQGAPGEAPVTPPPVSEILDVDREYRERVARRSLPRIAPRRFNPTHEAWLPILHTRRGARHYTALFSNTARAHELERTRDWVIVHLDDGRDERQWTVVTERQGPLDGRRVVRGREGECLEHS